eukprot:387095-Pelagomonas_calceolata.AAC.3
MKGSRGVELACKAMLGSQMVSTQHPNKGAGPRSPLRLCLAGLAACPVLLWVWPWLQMWPWLLLLQMRPAAAALAARHLQGACAVPECTHYLSKQDPVGHEVEDSSEHAREEGALLEQVSQKELAAKVPPCGHSVSHLVGFARYHEQVCSSTNLCI